jgi:ligand-binding sensor domain-containing protein
MYVKADGMKFSKINTLPDLFIQDIGEDRKGNIWIATMGNGVLCYNPTTARAKSYTVGSGGKSHISSNSVSSITFDHNGNPWFSTDRGGISMFNMKTRTFTSYSRKDGLPDDIAYKILEDKNNCLWFGTNQGLVRFNPHTKEVKTYRSTNGLTGNQYSYKSAVKTEFDTFLFGGVNGLVEFMPRWHPSLINMNTCTLLIYV